MLQTLNINCCKESLISEEGKIYQTNIYQTFQSILLTLWKAPLCGPSSWQLPQVSTLVILLGIEY